MRRCSSQATLSVFFPNGPRWRVAAHSVATAPRQPRAAMPRPRRCLAAKSCQLWPLDLELNRPRAPDLSYRLRVQTDYRNRVMRMSHRIAVIGSPCVPDICRTVWERSFSDNGHRSRRSDPPFGTIVLGRPDDRLGSDFTVDRWAEPAAACAVSGSSPTRTAAY